ncbi:helix-turn-helix transcriptional regulator [Iningainema tapete]|uniref:Helix-turn-helix transcriptional regulator n=1 Tax=Iningainema tapete BLCC-T55 TaxID=2748662 RepID=A0A8J6XIQ6_9CYAN|nr:AraC family transcriptional regulator [Iningainema tapete]MBD2775193.1 helix-turn-helix transcriptional regulator [Iningainema tapete BLCC-T55]
MTSIKIRRRDGSVAALNTLVDGLSSPAKLIEGIGFVQRFEVAAGETSEIIRLDHHLTLNRRGNFTLTSTHEGQRLGACLVSAGHIHFRPALMPHSSVWDGETAFTVIALNPTFVQTCAIDFFKQVCFATFRPVIAQQDQLCWALGSRLEAAAYDEVQSPRVFVEEVATLLAMHLLLTYGSSVSTRAVSHIALTETKLKQLYDYIEDRICEDIGLHELASLCGLSKYHFCRQFKQITGMTAHQYVIHRRIEAAKRLLAKQELTIRAVSECLGFASHSQFTAFFRRYTGVTPQVFRQRL